MLLARIMGHAVQAGRSPGPATLPACPAAQHVGLGGPEPGATQRQSGWLQMGLPGLMERLPGPGSRASGPGSGRRPAKVRRAATAAPAHRRAGAATLALRCSRAGGRACCAAAWWAASRPLCIPGGAACGAGACAAATATGCRTCRTEWHPAGDAAAGRLAGAQHELPAGQQQPNACCQRCTRPQAAGRPAPSCTSAAAAGGAPGGSGHHRRLALGACPTCTCTGPCCYR